MTGLVTDPIFRLHDTGPDHPENHLRVDTILKALVRDGLIRQAYSIPIRQATEEEILLCHTPNYLAVVKQDILRGEHCLRTGDTLISPPSLHVALSAAGGAMNAVDAVVEGKVKNAFCVVRPPGHHATRNQGMGFCIFNNVALAARYAQRQHRIARVLIVDWDVHHGNGTQDIFYEDGSVFYFSTHQSPWYPGTGQPDELGRGAGRGAILNCPVPAGAGRKEILGAFQEVLRPAMKHFKPEFILISAGFDSRAGDPLGMLTLTDKDFNDLTELMRELADQYAGGRLVSVLEGGYDLAGLASAVTTHIKVLMKE